MEKKKNGGVLAVLAVVVPTVLPLGLHPLSTVVRGDGFPAEWLWNLLYVGYPALVSASAALPGLLAAILLIAARPRRSRPLGAAGSIVGILLAGAFTVEAAVALVRQLSGEAGWWALGWYGVAAMDPYPALALSLGLLVMIVLMGIGTGMLLGSASLLTRLGGWLLVVALVLRVLSQIVSWGMGYWLTIWMARTFESGWVLTLEWAHALAVAPLAALGLLLALIGLVTGPRRRDPAEPSPPAGGPTSAS